MPERIENEDINFVAPLTNGAAETEELVPKTDVIAHVYRGSGRKEGGTPRPMTFYSPQEAIAERYA